jgi:sugar phosphate isomerase/epimerase
MDSSTLTRRHFLSTTALAAAGFAAGCASKPGVGTGKSFKGPVGLQLYSLRAQFMRDVPGSIQKVASYGIKEVELAGTYNFKPEAFRDMLLTAGLQPVSQHVGFERYEKEPAKVAAEAKALGLKYTGCAWIPHKGAFDAAQAKHAAKVFNDAGKILADQGLKCFYHCHGFEFEPGDAGPGTTAMDILLQETDPRYMAFQMDILWVVFPGQDPAAWLMKYPGRWELMHLKDLKPGVATGLHTGGTDPNNDVVLGTGQMNWPKILAAARKSGVKHYFIEDESVAAPEHIPQSLAYLSQVKF